MCNFTKNYYIYMSCADPGAHFCSTSTDGSRKNSCPAGPHERYIVIPESCPLCSGVVTLVSVNSSQTAIMMRHRGYIRSVANAEAVKKMFKPLSPFPGSTVDYSTTST
ncbi:uncharacterized protein UV8b_02086 [Ustilaginoidea virens]|uniref:Uncharacterized protein n=1 Tax=Ustilaginoidea virens TaxID=1159556 RepID=A0A8E5HLT7_USTVR|nr:uncharacterized protein UV8b_02086 [Ustilaginoidea virens]QUC17845.1 hypothetical protein UV8b_02086 [Ustilaginoidea virens]